MLWTDSGTRKPCCCKKTMRCCMLFFNERLSFLGTVHAHKYASMSCKILDTCLLGLRLGLLIVQYCYYHSNIYFCILYVVVCWYRLRWIHWCFSCPVSLCRCSCVCRRWHTLANDSLLWRRLCSRRKWRLSRAAEQKQLLRFMLSDGRVNVRWYSFSFILVP